MDLLRLTWTILWLSFLCIGGGLGIIPEMERQAVQVHRWLSAREFVDAYTMAQLTPGPNMRVAIVIGQHAHGLIGALLAGLAMFVPTAVLTAVVSRHWSRLRGRPWGLAVERTLAPIGIGLMAAGVYTLARSAIHDARAAAVAGGAALLLATGRVPPIVVIVAAGVVGWLLG